MSTGIPSTDYIFEKFAIKNNLNVSFSNTSYCDINKTDPDFKKLQKVQSLVSNLNLEISIFSILPTIVFTILWSKVSDIIYMKFGHRFYYLLLLNLVNILTTLVVCFAIYNNLDPSLASFKAIVIFANCLTPYPAVGAVIFQILQDTFTGDFIWKGNILIDACIFTISGVASKLFSYLTKRFYLAFMMSLLCSIIGLISLPFCLYNFPINYEKHKKLIRDSFVNSRAVSAAASGRNSTIPTANDEQGQSQPTSSRSIRRERASNMLASRLTNIFKRLQTDTTPTIEVTDENVPILPTSMEGSYVHESNISKSIKSSIRKNKDNIFKILTKPRDNYDRLSIWVLVLMFCICSPIDYSLMNLKQLIFMNSPICMNNYSFGTSALVGNVLALMSFLVCARFPSLWGYFYLSLGLVFSKYLIMIVGKTVLTAYFVQSLDNLFSVGSSTVRTLLAELLSVDEYNIVLSMIYLLQSNIAMVFIGLISYIYGLTSSYGGTIVFSAIGMPNVVGYIILGVVIRICFVVRKRNVL